MTEREERILEELQAKFVAGDRVHALEGVRELLQNAKSPMDRIEFLWAETMCLALMGRLADARQNLDDLKAFAEPILKRPPDMSAPTPQTRLAVMCRYAEMKVAEQEGDEKEALRVAQELLASYPKQLAAQEILEEVSVRRAFYLANAGRWAEAKPLLEHERWSDEWRGYVLYCLGQCFSRFGKYGPAKQKLQEALNFELMAPWPGRVHYELGIAEYHFSDFEAAKKHFELCLDTADPEYLGKSRIWEWLEATSRKLGMDEEAKKYRKIHADLSDSSPERPKM